MEKQKIKTNGIMDYDFPCIDRALIGKSDFTGKDVSGHVDGEKVRSIKEIRKGHKSKLLL